MLERQRDVAAAFGNQPAVCEPTSRAASEANSLIFSKQGTVNRTLTTSEMLHLEPNNIAQMQASQGQYRTMALKWSFDGLENASRLSRRRREAAEEILNSRDQIIGLLGIAGAGKTTSRSLEAARVDQLYSSGYDNRHPPFGLQIVTALPSLFPIASCIAQEGGSL